MTTLVILQRITFIISLIAGFMLNHMGRIAGLSNLWLTAITLCGFSGVIAVLCQLIQEHYENTKIAGKMNSNHAQK